MTAMIFSSVRPRLEIFGEVVEIFFDEIACCMLDFINVIGGFCLRLNLWGVKRL